MNISTQSQGFAISQTIDRFVRRSVRSALHRFDENIVAVDVYLKDMNGPKGGVDKQAVICVRLLNRQQLVIETRHENLFAAVKAGARRIRRAVRRQLHKSRGINRTQLRKVLGDYSLPMATSR